MGEDGAGVRTGLGHGGITCVLQTQFSSLSFYLFILFFFFIRTVVFTLSGHTAVNDWFSLLQSGFFEKSLLLGESCG